MAQLDYEHHSTFRSVHFRILAGYSVTALVLCLAQLFEHWLPLPITAHTVMRWLGGAMLGASTLWCLFSIKILNNHIKQKPATQSPSIFISHGTFAFSRNPIFLSMLGLQLGIGFVFSHAWTLLTIGVTYIILNDYLIPHEEMQMSERYGQAWQYRSARIKRWLSWPHRRSPIVINTQPKENMNE